MKSSLTTTQVQINDEVVQDLAFFDPFTVYVNPYYVITSFTNGDKVSKHYYMGTQRVATDLGVTYTSQSSSSESTASNSPENTMTSSRTSEGSGSIENTLAINIMNIIGRPTSDTLKSLQFNTMTLEQAYPDGGGAIGEEMPQIGEDPGGYPGQERILYWYHPDYIQNVDLVTDLDGEAYELFLYNPWGEQLHHWSSNSSSWTSPYRFNAKEVDPETGLAYYGARYYQSKLGVWLSVDAMAIEYIGYAPYNFVLGNPITLIDPDGNAPVTPWWPGVTFTFIESEASTGVGVGAQAIIQRGVARDEVGKTHFTAGQAKWINASTNRKTEIQGGASVSGTVNVRQSFKRETFWGMLFDEGWNMTGDAGLGVGITLGVGDMEFTVGIGLAAGARIAVGSTEIIESVSLTDNQADFVNKRAADAGVNNSWTVTDVREYGDGWKANVLVGDGKNSVKTSIEVRSSDRKVWMSQEYINAAKKADGFDF
jgi:RHS repeat-associated protein